MILCILIKTPIIITINLRCILIFKEYLKNLIYNILFIQRYEVFKSANQVIPIIYSSKTLIDNTKQGLTLLKAMNHLNDIDFDEIEKELKPISKENNEIFENML